MDEMRDKVKGFAKKLNNPFSSSSSGRFRGQGRVLGSSPSGPSNPAPSNPAPHRPSPPPQSNPLPISNSTPSSSRPPISSRGPTVSDQTRPNVSDQTTSDSSNSSNPEPKPADGFDPFQSLITSGRRSQNGVSVEVFKCPICELPFRTMEEVSEHAESCEKYRTVENGGSDYENGSGKSEMQACVGVFLSGKLASESVEVVLRLLKNIVKEPENAKFRRIRMGNPKIKEAIVDVAGGVELLEFLGFELKEEDGEIFATMEVPQEERIHVIESVIGLLQQQNAQEQKVVSESKLVSSVEVEEKLQPKKIDREVC